MDVDAKHVALGSSLALCVITLAWNIHWRHYSRYLGLVFPRSLRTPQKKAIRIFFAFAFAGSLTKVFEVFVETQHNMSDLLWSSLYGAIMAVVFFAMDGILRWLRPDG